MGINNINTLYIDATMYKRSEDWRNISFYIYLKWNALKLHVWTVDSLFYPSNEDFIIQNGISEHESYLEALDNPLNITSPCFQSWQRIQKPGVEKKSCFSKIYCSVYVLT